MLIKSIKKSAKESLATYRKFYEDFINGQKVKPDIKLQERKLHFQNLIDFNIHFLKNKFGNNIQKQIEADKLNIFQYLDINNQLFIEFLGQELFNVIQKKDTKKLNNIHRKIEKDTMKGRFGLAQSVIKGKDNIAIVAIRPELMHAANLVKDFFYANGFEILFSKKRVFTPAEFFTIYKDMIDEYPDYYKLFPTIMLIYTGKMMEILFVKKAVGVPSNESLPKHISSKYKGLTGKTKKYIMKKNTFRTDILYREYVIANKLLGVNLEIALDPLRIIKNTIRGLDTGLQLTPILTNDPYIPYLVKAQAGVHVPTSLGIVQFMAISFTKDELLEIKSVI